MEKIETEIEAENHTKPHALETINSLELIIKDLKLQEKKLIDEIRQTTELLNQKLQAK